MNFTVAIRSGRITSPTTLHAIDAQASIRRIVREVAHAFGVDRRRLFSRSKRAKLAFARQVAIALSYELTNRNQSEVAGAFGRHEASVRWAISSVNDRCATEPATREEISRLKQRLQIS